MSIKATPQDEAERTDEMYREFKSEVKANYRDLNESNQVWRNFAYEFALDKADTQVRCDELETAVGWIADELGLPTGLGQWGVRDGFEDSEESNE